MIKRILKIHDGAEGHVPALVSLGWHWAVPMTNRKASLLRVHISQEKECIECGCTVDEPVELTLGQLDSLCEALQDMKRVLEQRLAEAQGGGE